MNGEGVKREGVKRQREDEAAATNPLGKGGLAKKLPYKGITLNLHTLNY